jgi:hypothetical protein
MSLPFDGFKAAQTGLVDMGNISFYDISGTTPAFNVWELAPYKDSLSEIVLNVTWAQLETSEGSYDTSFQQRAVVALEPARRHRGAARLEQRSDRRRLRRRLARGALAVRAPPRAVVSHGSFLMVKASGAMPRCTCSHSTGAAIGKPGRARGEKAAIAVAPGLL